MRTFVLLFESTTQAYQAASKLEGAGISHRIISAPRAFSADCSMAVEVNETDLASAKRICPQAVFHEMP